MLLGEQVHVPEPMLTYLGFNNLFPSRQALVSAWQDLSIFSPTTMLIEGCLTSGLSFSILLKIGFPSLLTSLDVIDINASNI